MRGNQNNSRYCQNMIIIKNNVRRLISDAHKWINEIATAPIYKILPEHDNNSEQCKILLECIDNARRSRYCQKRILLQTFQDIDIII